MNILLELITKLSYHDTLNPVLWDDFVLKDNIRSHLLKVANKFTTTLKIDDSAIKDYVLTGSNANYNWTSLSDIDVHVIIDYDVLDCECSIDIEDCLLVKKSLWNDRHDITVMKHPVELYASNSKDRLVQDSGCYSILRNEWIRRPALLNATIDETLISNKAGELAKEIDGLIDTKTTDQESIQELMDRIWTYRKSGLEKGGEFSVENLVFKTLRNNGYLDKLIKYSMKIDDGSLSLEESLSSKPNYKVISSSKSRFLTKQTFDSRDIVFSATQSDEYPDLWDAEFYEIYDNENRYGTTGSGQALAVLSMVAHSFKEFIDRYHPEKISFTAEKDFTDISAGKRGRIYESMFNKFASSYKLHSEILRGFTRYTLTRK